MDMSNTPYARTETRTDLRTHTYTHAHTHTHTHARARARAMRKSSLDSTAIVGKLCSGVLGLRLQHGYQLSNNDGIR